MACRLMQISLWMFALPNPHYIDELRPLTGMDQPVYDYVMGFPETDEFYTKFIDLLRTVLPGYKKKVKVASPLQLVVLADNIALLH